MSTLETNSIGKYNGNNVSVDDALRFKNYTTTQRDALTSVAGDTIYNTTTSKVEYYDGSAWQETGGANVIALEYLIVAGAGGGGSGRNNANNGNGGGGGGAGGVITNVSGNNSGGGNSANPAYHIVPSTNYKVVVGAGGAKGAGAYTVTPSDERGGTGGGSSRFGTLRCRGGGGGLGRNSSPTVFEGMTQGASGGSSGSGGVADAEQGYAGGQNYSNYKSGGGGGAGAVGVDYNVNGKHGGIGVTTNIITTSEANTASVGEVDSGNLYFGGGGGSPKSYVSSDGNSINGNGGLGGGADAGNQQGSAGTANTGGGGSGGRDRSDGHGWEGGNGGSGVVILRYPNTFTITVGAGLTSSTITQGDNKVTIFTAGSGNVSFS